MKEGVQMVKRLLSANTSEILMMTAEELKQSIKASEGRVIVSENIVVHQPMLPDITNAEIASAYGADLILLNLVDLFNPEIQGLTAEENQNFVATLHNFTGRPIGVNLEPVDYSVEMVSERLEMSSGRQASRETFVKANELGLDFVCLTGNPGAGISNDLLVENIKVAKEHFHGLTIAGKMHGAGSDEPVLTLEVAKEMVDAGVDILMIPSIGTVPGVREATVYEVIDYAHSQGALVMSAIGTSQESGNPEMIQQFALRMKEAGVDIQHIGDSGYGGLALVDNIYAMSIALRGLRHTVSRISRSINR